MTLPRMWKKAAAFVIRQHMRAPRLTHLGKIVDLLFGVAASGLSMREFNIIIRADHGSLPDYLRDGEEYLAVMRSVDGSNAPPALHNAEIGRWLRDERIRTLKKFLLEK